jgi:hypothetical protein
MKERLEFVCVDDDDVDNDPGPEALVVREGFLLIAGAFSRFL